jgi:TIR domain
MAYRIFLSHSAADHPWVDWLGANAGSMGIVTYLYENDPQPGLYVSDKVKAQIAECDALVVLLTVSSQYSPYVQQEIGVAEGRGKLVIPMVQPGVDQRALAMLAGREYIPFDLLNPQAARQTFLDWLNCLSAQKSQEETNRNLALFGLAGLLLVALSQDNGNKRR